MPPTKIADAAFGKLKDLATWVHKSAKMNRENNLLKCEDDDRYKRTLPLLKELEYDQIHGYGYQIYRTSGKTNIIKSPGLKTLFFPLSIGSGDGSIASGEVEVGGEVLTPGTFVQFDKTTTIDAHLDCLVVYLPE